jgi:hypothetical protein
MGLINFCKYWNIVPFGGVNFCELYFIVLFCLSFVICCCLEGDVCAIGFADC